MKYILTVLSSVILSTILAIGFGVYLDNYDSPFSQWVHSINLRLGTIAYPSSIDSFTNPAPTDSVATVSHSAQHTNENNAINAIETKVGTSNSTAIANSIFVGNGAGSSIWSTYATTTSLSSSIASTTNLTVFGSSTLQSFTGLNSTTTNATTTSLAISNFSSSIPYANANGSLIPTTIGTGLNLSSGVLTATAGTSLTSTTTTYGVATTTINNIGATSLIHLFFSATTTTPGGTATAAKVNINGDTSAIYDVGTVTNNGSVVTTAFNANQTSIVISPSAGTASSIELFGDISSGSGTNKHGLIHVVTTDHSGTTNSIDYSFIYKSTAAVTSISIGTSNATLLATSTYMGVITY